MLVQCPKCKTTYKVSDDMVHAAAPTFRCSRCKHTFELQTGEETAPAASTATGEAGANSELAFTFEPAKPPEPGSARATEPSAQFEASSARVGGGAKPGSLETVKSAPPADSKSFATTDADVILNAALREPHQQFAHPPREGADKVLDIEPYREQRASVMPFLTLFGLLIILSGFVLAYQKTHPVTTEAWVASIPLLGPSVVRNNHLKNGVLLKGVETRFQILQGNRDAVVLTGLAVNQNPVMIRNIQLSGQLFDHEGKEIERQTMWIGNAISLQIIRGMNAQDVTDLQRLKPLKTFEIPPGDSVPFAIVFLRPGKTLKDARCEVLSVDGV